MGPSRSFSLVGVYRSVSELGALGPVLAISPSSKLGIGHHFFNGLLILQGKLCQNFIIFLNRLDRSPKFQFRQNAWEQVRIRSTRACFNHIYLIRTRNRAPFFFSWTPYSSGKILSKFHNLLSPFRLKDQTKPLFI